MNLTLQQRLDAAQTAYHNLLLGNSAREVVDQNGERITYTAANRDALKAYIEELQAAIAAEATSAPRSRRPMTPFM
jgi:hypothetical protein